MRLSDSMQRCTIFQGLQFFIRVLIAWYCVCLLTWTARKMNFYVTKWNKFVLQSVAFEQCFPELHIKFKYVLAKEKGKTIHFLCFFHEAYSYFFLHFLFFASCRTLSFKRCLAFRTSSSSSLPEMRPSATDLGSLATLFQTISLFTVLLATMSSVKLRRKQVCSSVNFRQTREDSLELETANDSAVFASQLSSSAQWSVQKNTTATKNKNDNNTFIEKLSSYRQSF